MLKYIVYDDSDSIQGVVDLKPSEVIDFVHQLPLGWFVEQC